MNGVAAFSILALTVSLSLARPAVAGPARRARDRRGLGAILSLALGIVPIELVALALRLLFFPILTIVSLMVITLDRGTGRALRAARDHRGGRAWKRPPAVRVRLLLRHGDGMVFTNDAAVLIFTPLVFQLVEQVKGDSWTLQQQDSVLLRRPLRGEPGRRPRHQQPDQHRRLEPLSHLVRGVCEVDVPSGGRQHRRQLRRALRLVFRKDIPGDVRVVSAFCQPRPRPAPAPPVRARCSRQRSSGSSASR